MAVDTTTKVIGVRRAILSGSIGRWLYTASQAVVQLAIVPTAIHCLGVERYGLWLSMSALVGWLSISDPGMGTTLTSIVTRDIADGREKAAAVTIGRCLILVLFGSFVTLTSGVVLAPFVIDYLYAEKATNDFVVAIIISIAAFVINRAVGPLMAVSVAELRNIYLTFAQLASVLAQLAVCLCGLRLGYGVIGLAAGSLARSVVLVLPMLVRTLFFLWQHHSPQHRHEGRPVKELIHLAAANYPAVMLTVVTNGLDLFLIGLLLGGGAAAAYSVNGRPLEILTASSLGLASALTPVYARHSTNLCRSVVSRNALQLVLLVALSSVVGACAFVGTSAAFVTVWAGPETIGSAGLVCGLATAALTTLVVDVLMQTAMADARHLHELSIVRVVEKATRGLVVVISIYCAPLIVLPWAVAVVEAATLLILLRWMRQRLSLFEWPLDLRLIAATFLGIGSLGVAAMSRGMVQANWPSVLGSAAVFGLVCFGTCVTLSSDYRDAAERAVKKILGIGSSAANPIPEHT